MLPCLKSYFAIWLNFRASDDIFNNPFNLLKFNRGHSGTLVVACGSGVFNWYRFSNCSKMFLALPATLLLVAWMTKVANHPLILAGHHNYNCQFGLLSSKCIPKPSIRSVLCHTGVRARGPGYSGDRSVSWVFSQPIRGQGWEASTNQRSVSWVPSVRPQHSSPGLVGDEALWEKDCQVRSDVIILSSSSIWGCWSVVTLNHSKQLENCHLNWWKP